MDTVDQVRMQLSIVGFWQHLRSSLVERSQSGTRKDSRVCTHHSHTHPEDVFKEDIRVVTGNAVDDEKQE